MSEDNCQGDKLTVVYWLLRDVPELAGLSAGQKRQVHRLCVRRHFLFAPITWRSAFAYAASILSVVIFTVLGGYVSKLINVQTSIWFIICGAALGASVGTFLFSHIAIHSVRAFYPEIIEKEVAKQGPHVRAGI